MGLINHTAALPLYKNAADAKLGIFCPYKSGYQQDDEFYLFLTMAGGNI